MVMYWATPRCICGRISPINAASLNAVYIYIYSFFCWNWGSADRYWNPPEIFTMIVKASAVIILMYFSRKIPTTDFRFLTALRFLNTWKHHGFKITFSYTYKNSPWPMLSNRKTQSLQMREIYNDTDHGNKNHHFMSIGYISVLLMVN